MISEENETRSEIAKEERLVSELSDLPALPVGVLFPVTGPLGVDAPVSGTFPVFALLALGLVCFFSSRLIVSFCYETI